MSIQDVICPLCRDKAECQSHIHHKAGFPSHFYECKRCGRFEIGHILCRVAENGTPIQKSHILSAISREQMERDGPSPEFTDQGAVDAYLSEASLSIPEKANKALEAIARRTKYFGDTVRLHAKSDYPLGYAANENEFFELLKYLQDCGLVHLSHNTSGTDLILTAPGFEAVESRKLCPTTTVFISSTCYDLLDLRDELATHLEGNGFVAKVSEDPERF